MIQLALIGIGTGNPDHLTLAAVNTLAQADLVLLPRKGKAKSDLLDLRRVICERWLSAKANIVEFDLPTRAAQGDYQQNVQQWHDAIAHCWQQLLAAHCPPGGGRAALLIWGDPSLYDSSLRITERLEAAGLPITVTVVPGITSLQVLTAVHRIPLNAIGAPVHITTGRQLREQGWPDGIDRVAVMLDSGGAFTTLPNPEHYDIWWGAYLGMPEQSLMAGRLDRISEPLLQHRQHLRDTQGWIMDIYLLARRG